MRRWDRSPWSSVGCGNDEQMRERLPRDGELWLEVGAQGRVGVFPAELGVPRESCR